MELLDILENRIDSLVTEVESLRGENAKLREDAAAGLASLTEENSCLKRTLEEEQQVKDTVLKRIDGLLSRLQGVALDTR